MDIRFLSAAAAALLMLSTAVTAKDRTGRTDDSALNAQAGKEYLRPIRPGRLDGKQEAPFWNVYSHRFLYAPSFPFEEVDGARRYRFTLSCENGKTFSFDARSPQADLSPVWDALPVGEVRLSVNGLGKDGEDLGAARIQGPLGVEDERVRIFTRDYPYEGPYPGPDYSYEEAIFKGLHYIHAMPQVRRWLTDPEPDMSYSYYTYPCKIMGATIRAECLLARLDTACREEALAIARAAADFLIRESRPAGDPLAFFPPTYYAGPGGPAHASGFSENQGKTMMMEAIKAAQALLDLYAATGEEKYLAHAVGIADTYCAHQAEDGSLPIKVDIATGEPVNEVRAMLGNFLTFLQRLQRDFGQHQYRKAEKAADRWMKRVTMRTFDLTGQFEDVSVQGLHPYENLTNVTACDYANYLMNKKRPSRRDIRDVRDLVSMSEDQFLHWRQYKDVYSAPSVFEQHKYQESINSSNSDVACALIGYWRHTGDPLALAKARALVDVLVNTQETETGFMPTSLKNTRAYEYFWMNCTFHSIEALMKMEAADAAI